MGNLLKNKNNFKYIISVLTDNVGNALITFILPLLIFDNNFATIHLSIISFFSVIPFLLLGLPFGALVDVLNVRKILYISDFIRFLLYFTLSMVLVFTNNSLIIITTIYIVTIISSLTNVLNTISELTFIAYFVEKKDFAAMNSQIYGIQYIVGLVFPAIGGLIYSYVSSSIIFLFCGICFLFSSLIIRGIEVNINEKSYNMQFSLNNIFQNLLTDIKEGLEYLKRKSDVLTPLIIVAFLNILTVNFSNDSLIIFRYIMSFSTTQIGLILSISSVGALMGTWLVNKLYDESSFKKLLFFNIFLQLILKCLFVVFKNFFVISFIMLSIDMLQSILNIIIIVNRQNIVSKKYLGRINSIYKTVLIGINSIGYLIGGSISNNFTPIFGIKVSIIGMFFLIVYAYYKLFTNRQSNMKYDL